LTGLSLPAGGPKWLIQLRMIVSQSGKWR